MRIRTALFAVMSLVQAYGQHAPVTLPATSMEVVDAATGIPVTVRLSSFSVSPTEVTQAEFSTVMGDNPSFRKGRDLPVENVTWWEAIRYCNLRSLAEGLEPVYDLASGRWDRSRSGYRLLTDAEWSYAAGSLPSREEATRLAHLGPSQTQDTAPLLEWARSQGPKPVASLRPNEHGLFDLFGNVWEWVQDFQDPTGAVSRAFDPAGPAQGVARVVRGGSYLSTSSRWARGYRSSMAPEWGSRYTGFRVCRTISEAPYPVADEAWFAPYQAAPAAFAGETGGLSSLLDGAAGRVASEKEWPKRREALHKKWSEILGPMECAPPAPAARLVAVHHEPTFRGELMYLQVEPDYWEKIYLMLPPEQDISRPLPVVIVPYYDVDTPAGRNLGGRNSTPLGTRAFAHLAVQQGFAAAAIRWFGESYAEQYAEAVANLKTRHPRVTGLGKWVWDAQRLMDYLETRPEIDSQRIGMIGHSLGGKMTLYAAAMDRRVRAAVSSEPGIGLSFSNYEDFWYLGEKLEGLDPGTDHHELLGLMAPRPFLLIGGDSADKDESWRYINSAKAVYSLFGVPRRIGYLNHRKGHSPTPESVHLAMEWLGQFLRRE